MFRILWQVLAFVILVTALPLAFIGILSLGFFVALAFALVGVFEFID